MKTVFLIASVILVLLISKYVWVNYKCRSIGSFETEYEDILQRRNYKV